VDTHGSLETRFAIGFAACMTQFNRTLLMNNPDLLRAKKPRPMDVVIN
jgi:hypothetical protein